MDKPPSISIPTSVAYKAGNGCNLEAVPCMLRNTDGTTGVVGLLIRPSTSNAGKGSTSLPIKQTTTASGGKVLIPTTHSTTQFAPLRPRVSVSTAVTNCTPSTSSAGTAYLVAANKQNARILSTNYIDERTVVNNATDNCIAIKPAIYGASMPDGAVNATLHGSPLEAAAAATLNSYRESSISVQAQGPQIHYVAQSLLSESALVRVFVFVCISH